MIVRDDIGAPSIPDARVDFSYEVRVGKTVPSLFGSIVVFEFTHSYSVAGGGTPINSAPRFDGPARLWAGRNEAIPAREAMSIVFLNPSSIDVFAQAGMQPSLDTDFRSGAAQYSVNRDRDGFFVASAGYDYVFQTGPTLPAPRTIAEELT